MKFFLVWNHDDDGNDSSKCSIFWKIKLKSDDRWRVCKTVHMIRIFFFEWINWFDDFEPEFFIFWNNGTPQKKVTIIIIINTVVYSIIDCVFHLIQFFFHFFSFRIVVVVIESLCKKKACWLLLLKSSPLSLLSSICVEFN